MNRIAIGCRGLVKRYDDLVAVNGLDIEVAVGECFGLLGPNGAGKTTTVEMLEGLLEPDAGTIEILGQNWNDHEGTLRQRLGIQLQETQFPDKIKVGEIVTLFRSFYHEGVEPERVVELVGLTEKAGTWSRKLSSGQRQRLSLACALVGNPEALFLDEPTTGLDPQSRLAVWDIIGDFRRRGGTVLLTTHYMEEAERLCDRVAIIDHGKVIALGSPGDLIASLGAENVVEVQIEGAIDIDPLRRFEGVSAVDQENGAVRLTVGEVHRAVPLLLGELDRQGVTLNRLTTHHATLEDVFVSLTGRHLRES